MLSSGTEVLLFLLFSGFVVMSLYIAWLQIHLWITRQVLNRTTIVFSDKRPDAIEPGTGCAGSFGFLLVTIILIGFLFAACFAQLP